MKKSLALLTIAALFIVNLSATQSGDSWSRLYPRLTDLKQKYSVLLNLTPLDDRSLEPFFSQALDDLVFGDLSQYRENRQTYDDWEILTRTIVMELGDIKGQSSAETLWKVVETAEVPLLKAEAMIALGRMRAVDYAPEISVILRNLNFNVRADKEEAEIEAYGAVIALETMRDESGFDAMFFASIGWYSDRVTSIASEAVLTMSDDPIANLIRIMEETGDYNQKRMAFATAMKADASASDKSEAAVTALREGLKYAEQDYMLRRQLANLRTDGIRMLIESGASNPDAPVLLDAAIDEGDDDEKLIAIQALGIDGSDEAAAFLVKRLEFFNERQLNGLAIDNTELTLVRQLIYAMGEAQNTMALESLGQMSFIGYTPALIRLADEAINKINSK